MLQNTYDQEYIYHDETGGKCSDEDDFLFAAPKMACSKVAVVPGISRKAEAAASKDDRFFNSAPLSRTKLNCERRVFNHIQIILYIH